MTNLPSVKLKNFTKNVTKGFDRFYGEGSHQDRLLTPQIIILICLGIVAETMQLNGFYQNSNDLFCMMNSFALYGIIIQVLARLLTRLLGYEKKFFPLIKLIENFYLTEEKNHVHRSLLSKSIDGNMLIVKCYILITILIFHTPVLSGFILSAWRGELIMSFEIYLPFTDPKSIFGYSFGVFMQFFFSSILCTINLLFDVQVIFYSLVTAQMVDIIMMKIGVLTKNFNDFYEKQNNSNIQNPPNQFYLTNEEILGENIEAEITQTEILKNFECELINLIKDYEVYNDCIDRMTSLIKPSVLAVMYGSSPAIGLSLLYTRTISLPIGLPLTFVLFSQVLNPCLLGTIITNQNDRLLWAFYDTPWYDLSLKKQKIFLQFIHELQNTNNFEIPTLGALNMELFSDIINASYSFMMYLLNFF